LNTLNTPFSDRRAVFAVWNSVVFAKSMLPVTRGASQRGSATADRPQHCAGNYGSRCPQRHARTCPPAAGIGVLAITVIRLHTRGALLHCAVSLGGRGRHGRTSRSGEMRVCCEWRSRAGSRRAVGLSSHAIHRCDTWGEGAQAWRAIKTPWWRRWEWPDLSQSMWPPACLGGHHPCRERQLQFGAARLRVRVDRLHALSVRTAVVGLHREACGVVVATSKKNSMCLSRPAKPKDASSGKAQSAGSTLGPSSNASCCLMICGWFRGSVGHERPVRFVWAHAGCSPITKAYRTRTPRRCDVGSHVARHWHAPRAVISVQWVRARAHAGPPAEKPFLVDSGRCSSLGPNLRGSGRDDSFFS